MAETIPSTKESSKTAASHLICKFNHPDRTRLDKVGGNRRISSNRKKENNHPDINGESSYFFPPQSQRTNIWKRKVVIEDGTFENVREEEE